MTVAQENMSQIFKSGIARNRTLRLGFVPLTDCAPLVLAQELGIFHRYGLKVTLSRELGWAAVRDKIITGELDAAQAVCGMPVAATLGLGSTECDCVTGLVLNAHGNAITLSNELWDRGVRDGASLRDFIQRIRRERMLTFGVVFPMASHNFLLRGWLAAAGIDPDRDVRIVVVPPPQMPGAVKAGHIDGFCVGEPWSTVAIESRIGWCAAVSAELAPGHPEKVLVVRKDFAEECALVHEALIAALLDAGEYCQQPENREQVISVLARREFLACDAEALRPGLTGEFGFGHGRTRRVNDFLVFHRGDVNEPSADKAAWIVQQLRASGAVKNTGTLIPALARSIFRTDIYDRACALRASSQNKKENEKTENELISH